MQQNAGKWSAMKISGLAAVLLSLSVVTPAFAKDEAECKAEYS